MSAALRLTEGLNSGRVEMDPTDVRTDAAISFAAALLRPVFVPAKELRGRPVMRRE